MPVLQTGLLQNMRISRSQSVWLRVFYITGKIQLVKRNVQVVYLSQILKIRVTSCCIRRIRGRDGSQLFVPFFRQAGEGGVTGDGRKEHGMDKGRGTSKYYSLMQELKEKILSGRIRAGEKLPSENQQSAQ